LPVSFTLMENIEYTIEELDKIVENLDTSIEGI
jgi:hypothetical protein